MSLTKRVPERTPLKKSAKILGISLGVNPKLLLGGLAGVAVMVFWLNSRGTDGATSPPVANRGTAAALLQLAPPTPKMRSYAVRRRAVAGPNQNLIRARNIDPTRGDIDPSLRLDLLERLASVQPVSASRNLFETEDAPQPAAAVPVRTIMPTSLPPVVTPQYPAIVQPQANISFKYYGYTKSKESKGLSRGLFLDGDNVFTASEGELVQQRYLVVQLTPASAEIEDTQSKFKRTLPVAADVSEQP